MLDGTTRLIYMQAVVEAAIIQYGPHLRKVVRQLFLFKVNQPEFLYTWCINDAPATWHIKHLCKCGGVLPLSAPARHFLRLNLLAGYKLVDKCTLPHPGMPAEQGNFITYTFLKIYQCFFIGSSH